MRCVSLGLSEEDEFERYDVQQKFKSYSIELNIHEARGNKYSEFMRKAIKC